MSRSSKYRILRFAGLGLLVVLSIVAGANYWFSQHYEQLIKSRLPGLAAQATDSLYRVSFNDIHINIITRSITVTGLRLVPDNARAAQLRKAGRPPGQLFDITVPEAVIDGLKWNDLKKKGVLGCRRLSLNSPRILLYQRPDTLKDSARRPPPMLKRIYAGTIRISEPEFEWYGGDNGQTLLLKTKGGQIRARTWSYEPGVPPDTTRFFFARSADVRLDNVHYDIPGTLYGVRVGRLHFTSKDRRLSLEDLRIRTTVSDEAFYARTGMQQEIYNAHAARAVVEGLAWGALLQGNGLAAAGIALSGAEISVSYSREPPPNTRNKMGNYPHQMLLKMSLPVMIPRVTLRQCMVVYSELNTKTMRPGIIHFSDIAGTITNITNIPARIAENPDCRLELTGRFMNRSDIAARFHFLLSSKVGAYSLSARLLNLDGSELSEPAKALALAEIRSLQLHRLDLAITGNERTSAGDFTMIYNDLKVKIQKIDTITMNMRNRPLVSFAVNQLVLYNDNPMAGDTVRVAHTLVTRDSLKPFFNQIWRHIFDGVVQTAVRNEGLTEIVKRKQARKGQPKKPFFKNLFPKKKKKDTTR